MKIHVLRCGWTGILPVLARREGLNIEPGEAGLVWLPVYCYLVEHPQGLILIDTGWRREISPEGRYDRAAQRRVLPPKLRYLCHGWVEPGMAVTEQLAAMGIRPSDISQVLISHLDADCTSALGSLREARRFRVSEEELYWTARVNPRFVKEFWRDIPFEVFWFRGSTDGAFLGRAHDLLGDGSVRLVNLLGHTYGLFAAVISSGAHFAVLGSDGAISLDMETPEDASKRAALEWLRAQRDKPGCAAVHLHHDMINGAGVIEL